jgi:hypothetical protein
LTPREVAVGKFGAGNPDQADARPVTGYGSGQFERFVGIGRGGNQNAVTATTPRQFEYRFHRVAVAEVPRHRRAAVAGKLKPARIKIERQRPDAGEPEQLHGDLTDQTGTDHRGNISEFQPHIAHPMQRNSAQSAEAGLFIVNVIGNRGGQIDRNHVEIRVVGKPGPGNGKALTHVELSFGSRAKRHHIAAGGIAQRQRFIQSGQNGANGRGDTIPFRFIDYLAHQIRPCSGFRRQIFLGELHNHALGPGGYQRRPRAHQKMPIPYFGIGDVF